MLLRSSSTPILNSWIPHHHHSSTSLDPHHHHHLHYNDHSLHLPRTKSISSLTTSFHSHSSPPPSPSAADHSKLSEIDRSSPPKTKSTPLQRLFSSSGLDEAVDEEREETDLATVVDGGNVGDGAAGGGNNDNNDRKSNNNSNHGRGGNLEEYYLEMIEANPGNPLLLGNYAKFLKEVRRDLVKAEEYCGRAILGSPSDANMLALYADIIWQTKRDAERAESYFNQAVQNAPDNSYVLASYAKFLWEVDDEGGEEEGEGEAEERDEMEIVKIPPKFLEKASYLSPLAAS